MANKKYLMSKKIRELQPQLGQLKNSSIKSGEMTEQKSQIHFATPVSGDPPPPTTAVSEGCRWLLRTPAIRCPHLHRDIHA